MERGKEPLPVLSMARSGAKDALQSGSGVGEKSHTPLTINLAPCCLLSSARTGKLEQPLKQLAASPNFGSRLVTAFLKLRF